MVIWLNALAPHNWYRADLHTSYCTRVTNALALNTYDKSLKSQRAGKMSLVLMS